MAMEEFWPPGRLLDIRISGCRRVSGPGYRGLSIAGTLNRHDLFIFLAVILK